MGAAGRRRARADRRRLRREARNPELALAFLADHPGLNVAAQLGLDWNDLRFIRVAGAIEVLFGLLLISGALPQAVVVIAGVPFNASLWFFGVNELLGHLPVYAAMLVLLVYGSDRECAPASRICGRGRGHVNRGVPSLGPGMKVLSIDGGGIRGLIPALVLGEIEHRAGPPRRPRCST